MSRLSCHNDEKMAANQEGCQASDNCSKLGLNICEMFLTRRQVGSQMLSQQQNQVLMFEINQSTKTNNKSGFEHKENVKCLQVFPFVAAVNTSLV